MRLNGGRAFAGCAGPGGFGRRQRLRRISGEFDECRQNSDTGAYQYAEPDNQLVFHFLEAMGKVDFHHPGGSLLFCDSQFQRLDFGFLFFDGNPLFLQFLLQVSFDLPDDDFQCLDVSFDFLDVSFDFLDSGFDFLDSGFDFLDSGFQSPDIPLVGEVFIAAGLSPGKDFGLGLRHAGVGQAFDEVVGVKSRGFCFHGKQNNDQGEGLQVSAGCVVRAGSKPSRLPRSRPANRCMLWPWSTALIQRVVPLLRQNFILSLH